jgi:sensor histidine kinase YesM
MTSGKFIIKHILKPIALGLFLGIFLTLIFDWGSFSWSEFFEETIYAIILTFLFWKGNEAIARNFAKNVNWLENPRKKVLIHVILAVSYSIFIILLFYLYIWFIIMKRNGFHGFYSHFNTGIYICFSINVIFILISYSYHFFKSWKKSVLAEEQLKRESLVLQYESLKNQVNPHFLFNSLNVLTSLIERDSEASIKYVKQLSEVFRYVLDQNARELVPIETELKFIGSYIYLQKIRFGENFKIHTDIREKEFLIVPMALQILIENVVKHNEISSEHSLEMSIYDDPQFLIVKNSIQPRNYLPDSNQVGLKTLEFQYDLLSGRKLEVFNDGSHFVVKLPKIKNSDHAGAGN